MNEQTGTTGQGNFFTRFLWVFMSPKRLYADIAAGSAPWWQPWVWVSVISMVAAQISIPIQLQLARLNPADRPQEELEKGLEMMEKFGFLGVISTPVVILIASLIIVGISYLVLSMVAEEGRFKKYLSLYLYASIISTLGTLLGTGLALMKGVENIRSREDAMSSFGPAVLLPPGQKILHAVLATSLDVFQIWFFILLGAGLVSVFKLSKGAAAVVILPVWLVVLLMTLLGTQFSGG
jgi:hypothetical protein